MRAWNSRLGKLVAVASVLGVLAGMAGAAIPAAAQNSAALAPASLAPTLVGQITPAERLCVIGFSKDFGALRLNLGTWTEDSCLLPVGSCETLSGRAANAGGFFVSDGATCHNGLCDEAPDLDGRFEAIVDVDVRLQDACPVRGSWGGTFRLLDPLTYTVLLASGTIDGTLGVGTHREETNQCEGCSVARFETQYSRWYFHSEGFIDGKVVEGPHAGCEMRISFQGEFNANGDAAGPQPPNYNWGFEGKADGVLLCPCE